MWTPIRGNNTNVVDLLAQESHISAGLDDLVVRVVICRNHGRPGIRHRDTTLGQGPVLGAVELMSAILRSEVGRTLLRRGSQRGNAAIGRIDNQRRSAVRSNLAPVPPELVVSPVDVGDSRTVAVIGVDVPEFFLFEGNRFLFG